MIDLDDSLDELLRRAAKVHDDALVPLTETAGGRALLEDILAVPYAAPVAGRGETAAAGQAGEGRMWRERRGRHLMQIALAAALALAVALSAPAFGVVRHIKSWLSGQKGADAIVPTAPDVVIASGEAGVGWRIIATPSDEGLCLFLVIEDPQGPTGGGGCGPSDVRGDPAAGSGPLHWVEGGNASGGLAALNRIIVWGGAAEEVARVDLELANGRTITAQLVARPPGLEAAPRFFWAVLGPAEGVELSEDGGALEPRWPLVHALVARDAAGTVLERRIVDEPQG